MDRLASLQRAIEARAEPDEDVASVERLSIVRVGGLVHLDFYGSPFSESYQELMEAVADASVAECLASLQIRGPDEGANGTRNWDLTELANCAELFPHLRSLSIDQSKPGDHNRTIVASTYDENGMLARILAKAPALETLVSPSAPNAEFFQVGPRRIYFLSVDAGYDHQRFILNLSRSSCFPELRSFEFGEYNETYLDDFAAHVTPLADYQQLFASPAFAPVEDFRWRNPACTAAEIAAFEGLKEDREVEVVRWSAEWLE